MDLNLEEEVVETTRTVLYDDFFWELLPIIPKQIIIRYLRVRQRAKFLVTSKSNMKLVKEAPCVAEELKFRLAVEENCLNVSLTCVDIRQRYELEIWGLLPDEKRTDESLVEFTSTSSKRVRTRNDLDSDLLCGRHKNSKLKEEHVFKHQVKTKDFVSTAYTYLASVISLYNGGIERVEFDTREADILVGMSPAIPLIKNCKDFIYIGTQYRQLRFWLSCLDPRNAPDRITCGQTVMEQVPGVFNRQTRMPELMRRTPMLQFDRSCVPRGVLLDCNSKIIWIYNALIRPDTINAALKKWIRGEMPNLKLMRIVAMSAGNSTMVLRGIQNKEWKRATFGPIDPAKFDMLQFSRYASYGKGRVRTIRNQADTMTAGIVLDGRRFHFMVVEERTVVNGEIQYKYNEE